MDHRTDGISRETGRHLENDHDQAREPLQQARASDEAGKAEDMIAMLADRMRANEARR